MSSIDSRKAAEENLQSLVANIQAQPKTATGEAFLQECAALAVAIRAFHMEGIRFRIYNVDRLLAQHAEALPAEARALLEETRRHLEAAGFHTRSHQSPV